MYHYVFQVVKRSVLPLEGNAEELTFMSDLKQEITEGFAFFPTSYDFFPVQIPKLRILPGQGDKKGHPALCG